MSVCPLNTHYLNKYCIGLEKIVILTYSYTWLVRCLFTWRCDRWVSTSGTSAVPDASHTTITWLSDDGGRRSKKHVGWRTTSNIKQSWTSSRDQKTIMNSVPPVMVPTSPPSSPLHPVTTLKFIIRHILTLDSQCVCVCYWMTLDLKCMVINY